MHCTDRRWIVPLLGLFILALPLTAHAQGEGSLEGQVINGTAGGPEVGAGVPVILRAFQGEIEVESKETVTDDGGRFRFEGLDTDATLEYWLEADYLGVPYSSSAPFQFTSDDTALAATITVYETTDDDSTISLDSIHFIAESFGEVLRISEIHLFGNSGDRTYVGRPEDAGQAEDAGPLGSVFIPLPQNALGLAFEEGASEERYMQVEDGLVDTEPVPPGRETSLAFFSYHLVVSGDRVPLERRFAYPVATLNVLVAQPDLTLRSDQLTARGTELFQGRQYEFYGAQGLDPDSPLFMEFVPLAGEAVGQNAEAASAVSGQQTAGASTRGNQGLLRWLGFGLAGLAVAGVVVYALTGGRAAPAPNSAFDLTADPKGQRLLADLADLEDAYEAGQVDEATYERQRAEIYNALKSLRP